MNAAFHSFFGWLLRSSWQAAVLTILVLAAQFCLGKRLDGRWRHLLWFLVLARLVLPWTPPSPASLYNLVRFEAKPSLPQPLPTREITETANPPVASVAMSALPVQESITTAPASQPPLSPPPQPRRTPLNWFALLGVMWAGGAAVLTARVIVQNILFRRRLRFRCASVDAQTLRIFEECRSTMSVSSRVNLIETELVENPALYGLFQLRLLLPPKLSERFAPTELRHIFLHELSHVRRHDMELQWLTVVLQIMHWFNPVLWYGFRRLAADREVACDELALSVEGEDKGAAYGATIVKLLEFSSSSPALPGLVGILEDKGQIFQRISMIARFRRRPRWSLLGVATAAAVGLAALTSAQTQRGLDLAGTVQLTNGQPANAIVAIFTAAPRTGTSPFCPSCYPDCRKTAKTDAQGRFRLESLDPELIFRLLVIGENCKPAFVTNVDPGKAPVFVKLRPLNLADVPPNCQLRGLVADAQGRPIKHATIEPSQILYKDGSFGRKGIDPLAVTDESGQFVLTARQPLAATDLEIEAAGFAKAKFAHVPGGGSPQTLRLTEGATIKGRVTLNGQPLPHVTVGLVSEDRMPETFTGNYEVGTDTNGQFVFVNLPPHLHYEVYGLMSSLKEHGATGIARVEAGADGSITDAGDLKVTSAYHIKGRVVLADGSPLPSKTKLSVDRHECWDAQSVDLPQDGSFSIAGVPSGTVGLSVRVSGYRPSIKNASLDSLNPFHLVGQVNHDIENLVFLLEKGPPLESHFDQSANGADLPENRPLAGAENAADHSRQREISGRVTGSKTGQPIASFRVTPGYEDPFHPGADWNEQRAIGGSNGIYSIYLPKDNRSPMLRVDAPGYYPVSSPKLLLGQTNYDVVLMPGTWPSGLVLRPDGKPATNAFVALACGMDEMHQPDLRVGLAIIEASGRPELVAKADATGHFALAPQLDVNFVAAASPNGFKITSVEALKTNPVVMLQEWAAVKGVLRRGGKPSTNEMLALTFGGALGNKGLNMYFQTMTDGQGAFEFERVPPVECEIMAENPTEDMPRRLDTLKSFRVDPGQILQIQIDAPAKAVIDVARVEARMNRWSIPPTNMLQGLVFLPDGKPAASAQIGFADQQHELHIGDGELVAGMLNPNTARSDATGAFTVPWPATGKALFVACDQGVARLKAAACTNGIHIVLQAWARVEGTYRMNGQPAAGTRIHVTKAFADDDNFAFNDFHTDTAADANGHFLFAHVLPGECGLGRRTDLGHGSWSVKDEVTFTIQPGASTNFVLGGKGRPVTGMLDLAGSTGLSDNGDLTVSLHTVYPLPPRPAGSKGHPYDMKELRKWRQSPEGIAALNAYSDFSGPVKSDGTFLLNDVLPGNYTVSVNALFIKPRLHQQVQVQTDPGSVDVPVFSEADQRQPLDIGRIAAKVQAPPEVAPKTLVKGQQAPELETQTLDGQPLKLADFRGKFVLLDFRYMLPGGEMEGMTSVNNEFGHDNRFIIITLCDNADADYVRQLKDQGASHWLMGNLNMSAIGDRFGLIGAPFPVIILLGPDGKVIDSQLHGGEIYASVARALGKN